ncbi:hypothetical protein K402DRAFT_119545 [Aulographum hederae CBS 113979]|uniref:Uncharacterized protein n=1 Tax=Aulographum hederae CBS 113979 TaxID=1176131 RepID=A0A6G1GVP1_9PEZI|nr:hypothetical protein K402DRAFT_119545 [Aulographum hederae CBS 113979]
MVEGVGLGYARIVITPSYAVKQTGIFDRNYPEFQFLLSSTFFCFRAGLFFFAYCVFGISDWVCPGRIEPLLEL